MMRSFFLSVAMLLLIGCVENNVTREELKGKAQGGYSDIIVVCDNNLWNKGLKDDVSFLFSEEIEGLYRSEQNFDITHVRTKSFSPLFKKQRIIVVFNVSSSVSKSGVGYMQDKYSEGQLYVKVSAENFQVASSLLLGSASSLREKLNSHRIHGLQKKIRQFSSDDTKLILKDSLGVQLLLTEYYSSVVKKSDFAYFGKRAKAQCQSGQNSQCSYQMGLFISKMKYDNEKIFEEKAFVSLRDSLTKKFIVGPDKEKPTYMECEKIIPLSSKIMTMSGHYCVEYKGWWNMVNATMGGPFISYLLVDKQSNQLYLIDGFVFAPNFSKRDFLMELEAMIKTFKLN